MYLSVFTPAAASARSQVAALSIATKRLPQSACLIRTEAPDTLGSWDRIQLKHVRTSHLLARHLKDRLDPLIDSEVLDAPVLVLQGADMPAVLIEVGYLSNPKEARALRDPKHLADVARAVSGAIKAFFEDLRKEK